MGILIHNSPYTEIGADDGAFFPAIFVRDDDQSRPVQTELSLHDLPALGEG